MNIIHCDESYAQAWDEYLSHHEQASFYHLFGWKRVNEASFGHQTFYLAAVDEGRIRGVFPLVSLKSRIFGNILCSLPFVNYGGPCADEAEIEQLLLNEAGAIVERHRFDYLEIRSQRKLGGDLPTSEHKVSITLTLDKNPDTLWNAFKTGHRNNIRRAYKRGLSVRSGGIELLDTFYDILSESWRNLGTPLYQKEYFECLMKTFPQETRIFVLDHDGVPVSSALNGHFHGVVEGMWLGALPKAREVESSYVLYWEMMKDACERGFQLYHLGRSTVDSGGEAFKKKWNTYPTQLYWQYIVQSGRPIPQLNVGNPKFQLAMSVWRMLPLPLTRVIGPVVAKGIP
ncbi:FemAB family XrtA/PEP-CTERM system-associated protein [Nitrospira sp. NS4]|uniref:FemAB family XrtA/PEP-CTERM system-associated protein n=1 Tax=Nitrospira sp. NS4 TaxID=3414498 RepID=UPI003C30655D